MIIARIAVSTITMACLTCVSASACPCVKESPKSAIKEAGAIFAAKVVSFKQGFRNDYQFNQKFPYIHTSQTWEINTTFSVSEVWKGTIQKEITLDARLNKCGGQFTVGEEYLVYAYWKENQLTTLPCTRTALLSNAGEDLRILGEGQLPERVQKIDDKLPTIASILAVMILALGAIKLLFRLGRRKKINTQPMAEESVGFAEESAETPEKVTEKSEEPKDREDSKEPDDTESSEESKGSKKTEKTRTWLQPLSDKLTNKSKKSAA